MKLNRLFKWLSLESSNLAIDLGTTNTLIYTKANGVVLDENSMVALHKDTRELIAAGKEVIPMLGRTPKDIIISEPLEDGVKADFKVVEDMLRFFIEKIQNDVMRHIVATRRPVGKALANASAIPQLAESLG